jgi:hypothetical protein
LTAARLEVCQRSLQRGGDPGRDEAVAVAAHARDLLVADRNEFLGGALQTHVVEAEDDPILHDLDEGHVTPEEYASNVRAGQRYFNAGK